MGGEVVLHESLYDVRYRKILCRNHFLGMAAVFEKKAKPSTCKSIIYKPLNIRFNI